MEQFSNIPGAARAMPANKPMIRFERMMALKTPRGSEDEGSSNVCEKDFREDGGTLSDGASAPFKYILSTFMSVPALQYHHPGNRLDMQTTNEKAGHKSMLRKDGPEFS